MTAGNLYGYVGDDPTNATDPTGLAHLPADWRGTWIEGTKGNGIFQYSDIPENRAKGIAGLKVSYANERIAVGGFPAEAYYGGSAAAASVDIDVVTGTRLDAFAADAKCG